MPQIFPRSVVAPVLGGHKIFLVEVLPRLTTGSNVVGLCGHYFKEFGI
jgi:hypothetical protein